MRRMLDPKEAGGSLPSTITFDENGNRKVGKDLGVDGKLTLKSLVSNTNPDGDITKELGGGGGSTTLYRHFVSLKSSTDEIVFNYYTISDTHLVTFDDLIQLVKRSNIQCSGYFKTGSAGNYICSYLKLSSERDKIIAVYSIKIPDFEVIGELIGDDSGYKITDTSTPVN